MSAERPARLAIVDALNFLLNGDESENEFGSDEEESDDDFADVNDDDDNVAMLVMMTNAILRHRWKPTQMKLW